MIAGGRPDVAERLLSATRYDNPTDRKVQRFFLAMAAKGQGRSEEAVAEFRRLLDEDPGFSRVRLELAHTLFALDNDEAARHHFELVLGGSATNPNLANTVRQYIAAIDSCKRWDLSGYVTIAPSTNFNQGSDQAIVIINGLPFQLADANRRKSGVGLATGVQGSYRMPVSERMDIVVSGGAHAKLYKDDDFNDILASVSIGPRYRFDWGAFGVYAIADHRWYAGEAHGLSAGVPVSGHVNLSRTDAVFADLTCRQRWFDDDWRGADLTYQDGHVCAASGRWQHIVDSQTYTNLLGGFAREETGMAHLDNDSWHAAIGVYRDLGWGVSLYLQAMYTDRDYDGDYPTLAYAREDRRWDLSANITKRDWAMWDFAPMLQYTYTTNDSNVAFHDYNAHGVNITFTKRY